MGVLQRTGVKMVNGVEVIDRSGLNVRDAEAHVFDHGALWEALIWLDRKVQRMESMLDSEES